MRLTRALPAMALAFAPAQAQAYPARPVTLVVPFAAGGPADTLARLVAGSMSRPLGQQVTVENAGGTLGAARVAKAAPDGYTLLLHNISQATSGSLYRDLPYDPVPVAATGLALAVLAGGLLFSVRARVCRGGLPPGQAGAGRHRNARRPPAPSCPRAHAGGRQRPAPCGACRPLAALLAHRAGLRPNDRLRGGLTTGTAT